MNKKILITGGLGFIFSHVTEHFFREGYTVMIIDNCSAGSHPYLIQQWRQYFPQQFVWLKEDVAFKNVHKAIVDFNPGYIVHAAAISDVDYSIKQSMKTLNSNINGTINIFEAAREVKSLRKLLYVSTDEVYGECDHPKTEDEIIFPKNPYSLSKAYGSLHRLAYDNTFPELKDKTVETRFCNVFGDRQDSRKIIPAIKRALSGEAELALHNDGEGYRQYIHVSEIPPLIELLLQKGSRTYNVTAGEGFTVNELIQLAEKITGKAVPVRKGNRPGMDMRYEMSSQRLADEFDWKPSTPFINHYEKYLCQS